MALKPWFQQVKSAAEEEFEREIKMRGMSRQELFNHGYITVADLDDEELRAGKCRDKNGRIPRTKNKTEPIPRDIYDAMVVEHEARFNHRLREKLDHMIDVMVSVAEDPTNEPRDRLEAAKYIFERVAGKTPDRVAVTVTKAPWEEMMTGIARISQEQSRALRAGVIDAEVIGDGEFATNDPGFDSRQENKDNAGGVDENQVTPPLRDFAPGDPRITYAPPAPTYDEPANSSSTATHDHEQHQQEHDALTNALQSQQDLVAARKDNRKRIQDAKKRRKIAKATGADAFGPDTEITAELVGNRISFGLADTQDQDAEEVEHENDNG